MPLILAFFTWIRALPSVVFPWIFKLLSAGSIIYILTGLGFGVLVYEGIDLIITAAINAAIANWSAIPLQVLQLVSLAGIPAAANILLSAHVTGIAIKSGTLAFRKFGFIGHT